MTASAFHILRVGLAITFLWIGLLILRDPEGWGSLIQPWVLELVPLPVRVMMLSTAVLDLAIGVFLLIDVFTWLAALFAAVHLLVVLTTTGIDAVTVRDIGLLAAAIALVLSAWPWRTRTSEGNNHRKEMDAQ